LEEGSIGGLRIEEEGLVAAKKAKCSFQMVRSMVGLGKLNPL